VRSAKVPVDGRTPVYFGGTVRSVPAQVRGRLSEISIEEASVSRRGCRAGDESIRQHLEEIGWAIWILAIDRCRDPRARGAEARESHR
jgi:hypothetical protein